MIIFCGKAIRVGMHRVILNLEPFNPKIVDHADHDGLNNQRQNIRLSTRETNMMNRSAAGQSGYLGVTFFNSRKRKLKSGEYSIKRFSTKYRSRIFHNGKSISLGLFKTAEEAALAYDEAAKKYHGEFANPNIKK